jgi:hypothetical protein
MLLPIYSNDSTVLFTEISRQYSDPKINGLLDPEYLLAESGAQKSGAWTGMVYQVSSAKSSL